MNDPNTSSRLLANQFQRMIGSRPLPLAGFLWFLTSVCLLGQSTIQFPFTPRFAPSALEDAGSVRVPVQRTDALETVVTVDYATSDDTAIAGEDYLATSGTLTFAAGETSKVISIPILNDSLFEGEEKFLVTLSNPGPGAVLGTSITAAVRIIDDDAGLAFEFARYSVREDKGSVLVGVVRADDGEGSVSVTVSTEDGTAQAGLDYLEVSQRLTIPPGRGVQLLTVPILNDGLSEPDETFRLILSDPADGAVLGSPGVATVTITDNDPGVQFEDNKFWVRENEGLLAVKVFRGNDVDLPPFTVDYATANLTAVTGTDYTETAGTLAFEEGEQFRMLSVPILWNQSSELDTEFRLTLSSPTGGGVLGAKQRAIITVLDMSGMEAHRFNGVEVLPDRTVRLILGGGVHRRFKDYFDLYPIEVSTNLIDWTPLATLQRTNSSTNDLTYTDPQAAIFGQRFYRTLTNQLITPVTKPTGPFPVGVVSRMLTDPARRNRYHVSTNGSFMIWLWYPAVAETGKRPGRLEDQQLALDPGWPAAWEAPALPDRQPYFVSHALPELACAPAQSPYPVVIYSHGAYDGLTTIMERGPEVASHGYVVVGVNHWDAFGTVFPDGTYLHGEDAGTFVASTAGFQDRVRDLRFVLDQLEEWNRTDSVFAGRLDLTKVATMGYSWGGGVAGEVARVDDRCQAAILLEGYFQNAEDLLRLGLAKATLSIYRGDASDSRLFNKVTHDAIWFQVTSTTHLRFVDYYWYGPSAQIPGFREAVRTMNVYILWFLNKHLKGSTDPLPALTDYPRVINFKQK